MKKKCFSIITFSLSLYSEKGYFETGMMAQSDWSAQWIGGGYNLLRDDLELDPTKTISKARLYVTSLGYNEVYINGLKAGTGLYPYSKNLARNSHCFFMHHMLINLL